jgi:hypothetical protein
MTSISELYDGWEGYHTSLVEAVAPLDRAQLVWRPASGRRSALHIASARITWFSRMGAPGVDRAVERAPRWADDDGERDIVEDVVPAYDAQKLVEWLTLSWHPIQRALEE